MDQTRGWFYSLLAISTLLFKQNAYRNVICLGLSSTRRARRRRSRAATCSTRTTSSTTSAPTPCAGTSSPRRRWVRTTARATDSLEETVQQFFIPLWNCYSFFVTYARLDDFDPDAAPGAARRAARARPLAAVQAERPDVVGRRSGLDAYDAIEPARRIQRFVDDLSNWYIRRSRRRFWKSQSDRDKLAAYQTLYEALRTLLQLMAPFAPFMADAIYRNLSERQVGPPFRLSRASTAHDHARSRRTWPWPGRPSSRAGRARRRAHQGPAAARVRSRCPAIRCPRRSRRSSERS